MKNEHYFYKCEEYVVTGFTMMKSTLDRTWVEAVQYVRADDMENNPETYTQELQDFVNNFCPAKLDIGMQIIGVCMGKVIGNYSVVSVVEDQAWLAVDGKVVSVMSTKHALTLKSTKGNLEILLHMGLDTVELKGRPFDIKVKENDIVKAGQPIAQMDIGKIKEAGKDPIVIMTITNMDDVSNFKLIATGTVKADMPVLKITSK